MTLIFCRNFDDELAHENGRDESSCTCNHPGPAEIEARIEAARSEAFQSGLEAGRNKALEESKQEADQTCIELLTQINVQLSGIFEKSNAHSAALEAQVLDLGLSVCKQVFPYLLQHQSHERAFAQIKKTMRIALDSPYISIAIPETAMPQLKPLIEQAADELGLRNQIKLLSDPKLSDGATHIEWKNGFMEYSFNAVCERILTALKAAKKTNSNPLVNGSEASV